MAEANEGRTSVSGLFNFGQTQRRGFVMIILLILFYTCTGKVVRNHEFDYLILSQRWLPSACIEYVESMRSIKHDNFCILPKMFKTWSVHGLWPTRNHRMGPFFCDRSMAFDLDKIESIKPKLELYWPNIEGGKSVASLWQHEWDKHGTCAAQLESLNSEIKYFSTTLSLFGTYNIQVLFSKNDIVPSENGYKVSAILFVIKNAFGKMPQVHCIHETKTKQAYLSEIRLCYNKALELIDCGDINMKRLNESRILYSGLTNCPTDTNIIIPDKVNINSGGETTFSNLENWDYYKKLYNTLIFIRFLQWISI